MKMRVLALAVAALTFSSGAAIAVSPPCSPPVSTGTYSESVDLSVSLGLVDPGTASCVVTGTKAIPVNTYGVFRTESRGSATLETPDQHMTLTLSGLSQTSSLDVDPPIDTTDLYKAREFAVGYVTAPGTVFTG